MLGVCGIPLSLSGNPWIITGLEPPIQARRVASLTFQNLICEAVSGQSFRSTMPALTRRGHRFHHFAFSCGRENYSL